MWPAGPLTHAAMAFAAEAEAANLEVELVNLSVHACSGSAWLGIVDVHSGHAVCGAAGPCCCGYRFS